MTSHVFTAKFTGGIADEHEFVIPHLQRSVDGAKRMLASYAHFYTNYDVPHAAQPETPDYSVRFKRAGDGCFFYDVSVNILSNGIWAAGFYGYAEFVHDHVKAFLRRDETSDPYLLRREPFLNPMGSSNEPVFDQERLHREKLQKLSVRTGLSLQEALYPVGRSVMTMRMDLDGKELAYFDHSTEYKITKALQALNLRAPVRGSSNLSF